MSKRSVESRIGSDKKGIKLSTIENEEPYTRWVRPGQFLSKIHYHILEKYKMRQHFLYRAFVVFRSENANMIVYSIDRNTDKHEFQNDDFFLFVIQIEKDGQELLHWSHTYNWNGGWFATHLKLLCLLDP